jgi:hypothetical protein
MKDTEKLIAKITKEATKEFASFGSGQDSSVNPISHALKDRKPMFAMGVDIQAVVKRILEMSGHNELVKIKKAAYEACITGNLGAEQECINLIDNFDTQASV